MLILGEKHTFEIGSRVHVMSEDRVLRIVELHGNEVILSDGRRMDLREVSLC